MRPLSVEAQNINWLINQFVEQVPGISHVIVVSADGLLLALSEGLPSERANQLSAIASGLWSLSQGGSACLGGGAVTQAVVEMHEGFLFVMSISDGSSLTVLASNPCDVGLVGYEMGRLVTRVGDVLTPALRNELRASLPH
ncbi:MAG TPA: roadblock/LC7 domain-containing protein [Mycobacteriales bacterium]